jgi:hypothetical protein
MDEKIFSRTPMAITHLVVDDSVLVRLALTLDPCSIAVHIWLRTENIRRSSLSYVPTPPNLRELVNSIALAARTKKAHSNDCELLNFNIFAARALRMFIKIFFF